MKIYAQSFAKKNIFKNSLCKTAGQWKKLILQPQNLRSFTVLIFLYAEKKWITYPLIIMFDKFTELAFWATFKSQS